MEDNPVALAAIKGMLESIVREADEYELPRIDFTFRGCATAEDAWVSQARADSSPRAPLAIHPRALEGSGTAVPAHALKSAAVAWQLPLRPNAFSSKVVPAVFGI